MLKHGKMKYEWTTNKGTLYFDFHGEVKQAKAVKDVYFESYTIAYSLTIWQALSLRHLKVNMAGFSGTMETRM